MKQVGYGAQLVPMFSKDGGDENNDKDLEEKLIAQLSHSDGIRGFMVSYLTVDNGMAPADWDPIPQPLQNALVKVENNKDLISLASE
jgi:hypothetical protein